MEVHGVSTKHFQSLKHVIKAKDPQVAKIDVAVEGFIKGPPLAGTLPVELTAYQVDQIIQAKEEPIPSEKEQEEVVKETVIVDLEEGFEIFDRPNPTESPETSSRPRPVM